MEGKRFVLFDFDGVIADSNALTMELSMRFHPGMDETEYRALYEQNVYESLKKLPSWFEELPQRFYEAFAPRMRDEMYFVSGMDTAIQTLAQSYSLAIISSSPEGAIGHVLDKHHLTQYFCEVLGQERHHSKVEKMAMVFKKYGVDASHCVYITDTLGDMREAQAHGMGTIASSWGVHPRETLEKGIPFRILNTPAELPDTVDDYFARGDL